MHIGEMNAWLLHSTLPCRNAALQAAALTSALYAFSQLLPEERTLGLADGDFVFDQGSCTQKTSDSIVYKARRWEDPVGVYPLKLRISAKNKDDSSSGSQSHQLKAVQGVPHVLQHVAAAERNGKSYLITERVQGGNTLSNLLNQPFVKEIAPDARVDMARQISRQLLAALAGMHSRGIAHGSLGLQSLYINASKDEQGRRTWTAKLVEFPSAVHFTEGERITTGPLVDITGREGKLESAAPEVLVRAEYGPDRGYPIAAPALDIWSLGIVLLTIATGKQPFTADEGVTDLVNQQRAWARALTEKNSKHALLQQLDDIPTPLAALAVRMLQVDPLRRPAAADALQHPFFAS